MLRRSEKHPNSEMAMSLVVAQMTSSGGPRVVSDTRVLLADWRRPSFRNDTLKAVIVRRDITACFAGDVALGLASIRTLAQILDPASTDY